MDRYCFVKDDDCNCYVIPSSERKSFNKWCEYAYLTQDFDRFNDLFEKYRIDSFYNFTFTAPKED
jgi:hypothetical protein